MSSDRNLLSTLKDNITLLFLDNESCVYFYSSKSAIKNIFQSYLAWKTAQIRNKIKAYFENPVYVSHSELVANTKKFLESSFLVLNSGMNEVSITESLFGWN
jgi:hypothetical protein